ncbi:hypothetical protein I4F81_008639 [Pyropia yezoensis]|uniref:Uncharacterized protein n=1 Tax=Pyropia yezoensis TaxID=2788 RepID=A0ACC3C728_PYRYE|nr:hypothetical protein I4F81_008639 [Neopyropia yezoensis]
MKVIITVARHKHAVVVPVGATWADLAAALLAALSAPAAARPEDVKLLWRGRTVADAAASVAAAGVTDGSRLVALVPRAAEELVRVVADRLRSVGRAEGEGLGSGGGGLAAAAEELGGVTALVREALRREH